MSLLLTKEKQGFNKEEALRGMKKKRAWREKTSLEKKT